MTTPPCWRLSSKIMASSRYHNNYLNCHERIVTPSGVRAIFALILAPSAPVSESYDGTMTIPEFQLYVSLRASTTSGEIQLNSGGSGGLLGYTNT